MDSLETFDVLKLKYVERLIEFFNVTAAVECYGEYCNRYGSHEQNYFGTPFSLLER